MLLQARRKRRKSHCTVVLACWALLGCSDPLSKPVDLFHDLEGGEIAAERPPPPGAGQPYPHVGTVPAKPVMPDKTFRDALQQELTTERNEKEVLAADLPMEKVPPPPGGSPAPAPAQMPSQAPGAPPPRVAGQLVQAQQDAAAADTPANATLAAADAPAPQNAAAPPTPPPPPADAALQIVGDPVDSKNVPLVPDGPPPPAALEGVAAEPAPTPRTLPPHLPIPAGTQIFFDQGSDKLSPSQIESIKEVVSHRKSQAVLVTGLGEADSDTPGGQETAIDLALRRARAVAKAMVDLHVPQSAIHIAAQPFGRAAVVTLL